MNFNSYTHGQDIVPSVRASCHVLSERPPLNLRPKCKSVFVPLNRRPVSVQNRYILNKHLFNVTDVSAKRLFQGQVK
jgi:hypothetical protein